MMTRTIATLLAGAAILVASPALAANDGKIVDIITNNNQPVNTDTLNQAMLDLMQNRGDNGSGDNDGNDNQQCTVPNAQGGDKEDGQEQPDCLNQVAPAAGDDDGGEEESDFPSNDGDDSGDTSNEQPEEEPTPPDDEEQPPEEDPKDEWECPYEGDYVPPEIDLPD